MPPSASSVRRALIQLRSHCRGRVYEHPSDVAPFASDFGGMVSRIPAIVLSPDCESDVVNAVRIAGNCQLTITTRGSGHSQSGQGLGDGILIDMARLNRVLQFTPGGPVIEVEGGCTWASVTGTTFPHGQIPVGLTQALDMTVAGSLSVGGVGAETFRTGPQVDNVSYLDVLTVAGDVSRCSATHNQQLYDAVRGGMGQCGIILRIGYPLRACKTAMCVGSFVYTDAERYLTDLRRLAAECAVGRWIASTVRRIPFFPRGNVIVLMVGEECNVDSASTQSTFRGLHCDFELPQRTVPMWSSNGVPEHGFFRIFGRGPEPALHPWVEYILGDDSRNSLEALLEPGLELGGGKVGLTTMRRAPAPAPLFSVPVGDLLLGVGLFASFPGADRVAALAAVQGCEQRMDQFAHKRYLSGYFNRRNETDWAEHYGDAWAGFKQAKSQFDAPLLLNPGFICWS